MESANSNVDASEQQPISADEAATRAEEDTQAKNRIITVERFLRALLGDKRFEEIGESKPTVSRSSSKKSPKDAFKTANIYFNHFIKVDSFEVMNQEFLLLAISRGAAIICANNFGSIDIVIPVWSSCPQSWFRSRIAGSTRRPCGVHSSQPSTHTHAASSMQRSQTSSRCCTWFLRWRQNSPPSRHLLPAPREEQETSSQRTTSGAQARSTRHSM
ncbi:hypothetical protein C8Q80DRAFT_299581 [Daedaleopsis nitida]|nr:hypothetical protein C8Q80DRAFT_299581 [Daedaleopsis nitida]